MTVAQENKILNDAEKILSLIKKRPCIIALDGRCAAGKSTLASVMKKEFGATVFHMDDFFLLPKMRTAERFASPGQNVDHERFLKEVLLPLSRGESFSYKPYECFASCFGKEIFCTPAQISVVEGVYSCRPELRKFYDLCVFADIDKDEQKNRILLRNADKAQMFFSKWIPLEEEYFEAFRIKENADLVLQN